MKELSIEEKARAYDEAIKKAAALYKASEPMSGCNVIIETLFPELAESEDEKVRKELIKHLKELSDWKEDEVIPVKNPSYYRQWISWLEKQAERKTPQWMIDFLDDYRRKIGCSLDHDEARDVDGKILCIMQWLENQGAQKPEENKGNIGGISANWSEEDEKILGDIIEDVMTLHSGKTLGVIRNKINWLKSLKGRVQTKHEWSEEDSYYINNIIHIIEEINNAPLKRREDWEAYINWLKSLRSQNNITEKELAQAKKNAYNDALDKIEYHSGEPTFDDGWSAAIDYIRKKSLRPHNRWKPSDEQMEALKAMARYCDIATSFDAYKQRVVESLYSELKKLKEG